MRPSCLPSLAPDTTSAGGDAHVSYNLAFQLVFYSRDGVTTLTDSIEANPDFGRCDLPAQSIQAALREVRVDTCEISPEK